MPRITYPIDPNGLLVDVVVGLRGLTISSLVAAGQPIPSPVPARGAIDTGTDVTVVSARILQRLGITPSYHKTTQTVSGQLNVQLFVVSVAPELVEPDLTVLELVTILPGGIEVLIGLDILRGCKFLLDGPANCFSLEF